MAGAGEAVYCTLLMSDKYLPGTMVLAHSLRDNGSKAKLVVLATIDSLQASTVEELKTIYDDVIPINRIANITPANLYLMNRPDLISTFSKIELWRQTQYRQVVYLDADVVALRAPDELLSLETNFAAVPDIGWPDCFNTGVMVLRPNVQDYYSLLAFAQRGISFDGADQGLLNMHFRNWRRLSFAYNCTPSGHYQYVPAFRHFQSTISLVHYIGLEKPWNRCRETSPAESPYSQLLGRWWAVYDRHYKQRTILKGIGHGYGEPYTETGQSHRLDEMSQHSEELQHRQFNQSPGVPFTQGTTTIHPVPGHLPLETRSDPSIRTEIPQYKSEEYPQPQDIPSSSATVNPASGESVVFPEKQMERPLQERASKEPSAVPQYVFGEGRVVISRQPSPELSTQSEPEVWAESANGQSHSPLGPVECQLTETPGDIEIGPRPTTGQQDFSVVASTKDRSASPPKFGWDASRAPPPTDSKPEAVNLPSHTYSMSKDTQLFQPPKSYPDVPKNIHYEVPAQAPVPIKPVFPWEDQAPPASRVFLDDDPKDDGAARIGQSSHLEDRESSVGGGPVESGSSERLWESYDRTNAWDEVPNIGKYVQSLQPRRNAPVQIVSGYPRAASSSNMKIGDFPAVEEHPSLPVTPAPVGRLMSWSETQAESKEFPPAEGVPNQEDWNPLERLEELQRRQSTVLDRSSSPPTREIPERELPGSKSH